MESSSPTPKKQPRTFIAAALDDMGLRPFEFRILCRIIRRGQCYESLPNLAKSCRMSKARAKEALQSLENAELITKIKERKGQTNIYMSNIQPIPKTSGVGGGTHTKNDTPTHTKNDMGTHTKNDTLRNNQEGNPIKGKSKNNSSGKDFEKWNQ